MRNANQQQHFSGPDSMKLFSQYGPFAVMELMENGDLATHLRKLGDSGIGSVSSAQAYLWAVQIADGMAYLERKKYVHRYVSYLLNLNSNAAMISNLPKTNMLYYHYFSFNLSNY